MNDTNVGIGMVYDTPEEKEIERLKQENATLAARLETERHYQAQRISDAVCQAWPKDDEDSANIDKILAAIRHAANWPCGDDSLWFKGDEWQQMMRDTIDKTAAIYKDDIVKLTSRLETERQARIAAELRCESVRKDADMLRRCVDELRGKQYNYPESDWRGALRIALRYCESTTGERGAYMGSAMPNSTWEKLNLMAK